MSKSLGSVIESNRLPFSEFLRLVLFEQPTFDGQRRLDRTGLSLLDFHVHANSKLTDTDFAILDNLNSDGLPNDTMIVQKTPHPRERTSERPYVRQSLIRPWAVSPWRQDSSRVLPSQVSLGKTPVDQYHKGQERVIDEAIEQTKRDQVLGLLLNAGRQDATSARMIVSFPSANVLDTLVHVFLVAQACQPSSWIHLPTFSLQSQGTEWIAMAAAVGAVLTPVAALRKLGFVLQENARKSETTSRFAETDMVVYREASLEHGEDLDITPDDVLTLRQLDKEESVSLGLPLAQALAISLDIGLWSGNQSKTESSQNEARILTMVGFLPPQSCLG